MSDLLQSKNAVHISVTYGQVNKSCPKLLLCPLSFILVFLHCLSLSHRYHGYLMHFLIYPFVVMNIKWDYSYYQSWSDNKWLVDEMLTMLNKDITIQ